MKQNTRSVKANSNQPAVPAGSSTTRKRTPPRTRRKKTNAGTPCPAKARPAWDPEPIFHGLVDELHYDPRDRM